MILKELRDFGYLMWNGKHFHISPYAYNRDSEKSNDLRSLKSKIRHIYFVDRESLGNAKAGATLKIAIIQQLCYREVTSRLPKPATVWGVGSDP